MTLIDYYITNYRLFFKGLLKETSNKYITEEVMQQVFLNLNRTCKSSDLANYPNPDNYIFTALYNTLRTYYRLNKKHRYEGPVEEHLIKETCWALSEQNETAEDLMALEDRFEAIVNLIEELPPKQKEVAIGICKGISMQEIATISRANYFTVKANWRYVARRLKKELNKQGEDFLWKVNI